jgi:hypothetical protein
VGGSSPLPAMLLGVDFLFALFEPIPPPHLFSELSHGRIVEIDSIAEQK